MSQQALGQGHDGKHEVKIVCEHFFSYTEKTGAFQLAAENIFVFGDIHGCAAELEALISRLPLTLDSTLVFLGDYVDRGSNSREVIEMILTLKRLYNVVALKGNHEELFLKYLFEPHTQEAGMFIFNGGSATIASYTNANGIIEIPPEHVEFLKSLQYFHQTATHFFVHAGVPDEPLEELTAEEHGHHMLWIRQEFLKSKFRWSKMIVHGHTPMQNVELLKNRINLDTACVYGNKLTAMHLPSGNLYFVRKITNVNQPEARPATVFDQHQRQYRRFSGRVTVQILAEQVFSFETLDFHEFGFLLRPQGELPPFGFCLGENIHGLIGDNKETQIPFEGTIVRLVSEADGTPLFGVKINKKSEPAA